MGWGLCGRAGRGANPDCGAGMLLDDTEGTEDLVGLSVGGRMAGVCRDGAGLACVGWVG